jgi:hypothetical protein
VTDPFTSIVSRREKNIMGLSSAWGGDRDDKSMSATDPRHAYGSMHVMKSGSHAEIDSFIRSTIQVTKKSANTEICFFFFFFKEMLPSASALDWLFLYVQSIGRMTHLLVVSETSGKYWRSSLISTAVRLMDFWVSEDGSVPAG